jgi:hypothetical protein
MFAQSNRQGLAYAREGSWGATPTNNSVAVKALRFTSESLDLDKVTSRSEVIRADRMNDELTYMGRSTAGDIAGELSAGDWDDFIAAALGKSAWDSVDIYDATSTNLPLATVTLSTVGGVNFATITITTVGTMPNSYFEQAGVEPGMLLNIAGFVGASNNGWKKVYSMDPVAHSITVINDGTPAMVTESTPAHISYAGSLLRNGIDTPSFLIEKQFLDITKYCDMNGLYINTMNMDLTSMERIKLQFGFMGKDMVIGSTKWSSATTAAGTFPTMTASLSVGTIYMNGVPVTTGVKRTTFDTTNNLRKQDGIGSATPLGYGFGSFELKGSTEVYFDDITLWQEVLQHTNVAQYFDAHDASGNSYGFYIPRLNFSKGAAKNPGINQDVMLPLDWEASRDPVSNSMFLISRTYNPTTGTAIVPGWTH